MITFGLAECIHFHHELWPVLDLSLDFRIKLRELSSPTHSDGYRLWFTLKCHRPPKSEHAC